MRFALLGTHPHGVALAAALVDTGRHELVAWTGTGEPAADLLLRFGPRARRSHDLEDVLADSAVEAVIVAGTPANRPAQLRRALQSERHVLCVHPPEDDVNLAYEASMLQEDTGRALVPILPSALHPAVARLAQLLRAGGRPLVRPRLLSLELWSPDAVLLDPGDGRKPNFPEWDTLRALGGEITEVSALTPREEVEAEEPVLLSGRFEDGLLFQASLLPFQHQPRFRLAAVGSHGQAQLLFPEGRMGPAFLSWTDPDGDFREEAWEPWDPWPALVTAFEQSAAAARPPRSAATTPGAPPGPAVKPAWADAVRCLELDDAVRRSAERHRSSTLEYQEVSEEVGFKGTMTLVGCGLIWLLIVIIIVANWFPRALWVVVPLLLAFLGFQVFGWVIPRQRQGKRRPGRPR